MYGLNAFALLCFGSWKLLAAGLIRRPAAQRERVIRVFCFLLLGVNLLRFFPRPGQPLQIPPEFSAVAYFVVPLVCLSRRRGLRSWAAYSGLMAGFFYYAAMIAAGGSLYGGAPSPTSTAPCSATGRCTFSAA